MRQKNLLSERLKEAIQYLVDNKIVKSRAEISRVIGIENSNLSNAINNKRSLPNDRIDALCNKYGINKYWLTSGEGMMLLMSKDYQKIPYYEIEATAGRIFMPNQDMTQYIAGYVDLPDFNDCDFIIPVRGDSMAKYINHGDKIICKKHDHTRYINYGNAYAIWTTQDEFMVKYIRKGKDSMHVLITSENPNYDSFDLSVNEIIDMFAVKGVIKITNF
jgi:SOS-response transcriptional repressor LexA